MKGAVGTDHRRQEKASSWSVCPADDLVLVLSKTWSWSYLGALILVSLPVGLWLQVLLSDYKAALLDEAHVTD